MDAGMMRRVPSIGNPEGTEHNAERRRRVAGKRTTMKTQSFHADHQLRLASPHSKAWFAWIRKWVGIIRSGEDGDVHTLAITQCPPVERRHLCRWTDRRGGIEMNRCKQAEFIRNLKWREKNVPTAILRTALESDPVTES